MPELDFSYDLSGVNRQAILQEAAAALDARRATLGPGTGAGIPTAAGDVVRELMLDHASLPDSLDLYRITDQDFLNPKRPTAARAVPVRFKELTDKFTFYWLPIRVGLLPRRGWAFNRLEVKLAFNQESPAGSRPKSWQVLPDRRFQTGLKVGTRLEVGLNENFEFSAQVAPPSAENASAKLKAGVDATTAAGLGLVAGPFEYRVASAKIDQNGPGMDWVFWRLDGAEFFQEDRPELVVILQVPHSTRELKIAARMQAYRYFKFLAADFRDVVKGIPEKLRALFEGGLPVADAKPYDLTAAL
jgi:hypothetical protein